MNLLLALLIFGQAQSKHIVERMRICDMPIGSYGYLEAAYAPVPVPDGDTDAPGELKNFYAFPNFDLKITRTDESHFLIQYENGRVVKFEQADKCGHAQ